MHLLKTDRLQLCTHPEKILTEAEVAGYARWVERRCQGEPVAYIVGEKEFWSLLFEVNREVLIPRPETECLIEEVLGCPVPKSDDPRIIDLGTGSGAIAVVLAREIPDARVVATDISNGALEVARRNAIRHGVADRIEFVEGDLFASVTGGFDLIVSNPPYIPEGAYPLLPEGIRAFEPRQGAHRRPRRHRFSPADHPGRGGRLKTGGWIFLEIGEGQRGLVEALFAETGGYEEIRFRKDYGGVERVAAAGGKKKRGDD